MIYLPVAIPLALATVVGGIDCTESAAAAGDDFPTGQVIATEGVATLIGGLFGGVIQTTPYIGHPAYKAMGACAGYTSGDRHLRGCRRESAVISTGSSYLIPKAVVFPILIFIGLEITAQSFHATKARHYAAVALACVPALAYLALFALNQVLPELGKPFAELSPRLQHFVMTITVLSGSGGFIVTSLLWGTTLTHLIDGRVKPAAATLLLAAVCRLVRRHPFTLAFRSHRRPRQPCWPSSKPKAVLERGRGRLPTTGRPPTPPWRSWSWHSRDSASGHAADETEDVPLV